MKGKYWYFTEIHECPMCGRGKTYRERRYDTKPENPSERIKFVTAYDWCDAL